MAILVFVRLVLLVPFNGKLEVFVEIFEELLGSIVEDAFVTFNIFGSKVIDDILKVS